MPTRNRQLRFHSLAIPMLLPQLAPRRVSQCPLGSKNGLCQSKQMSATLPLHVGFKVIDVVVQILFQHGSELLDEVLDRLLFRGRHVLARLEPASAYPGTEAGRGVHARSTHLSARNLRKLIIRQANDSVCTIVKIIIDVYSQMILLGGR